MACIVYQNRVYSTNPGFNMENDTLIDHEAQKHSVEQICAIKFLSSVLHKCENVFELNLFFVRKIGRQRDVIAKCLLQQPSGTVFDYLSLR